MSTALCFCGKASATSLVHSDRCKLEGLLREALRPGFLLRTAMDFELGALLASGATELSDWQDYKELVRISLLRKGCTAKVRLVGLTD